MALVAEEKSDKNRFKRTAQLLEQLAAQPETPAAPSPAAPPGTVSKDNQQSARECQSSADVIKQNKASNTDTIKQNKEANADYIKQNKAANASYINQNKGANATTKAANDGAKAADEVSKAAAPVKYTVVPGCPNVSNPHHECTAYCRDRWGSAVARAEADATVIANAEKEQAEDQAARSAPVKRVNVYDEIAPKATASGKPGVVPECPNISNPQHECTAYCRERWGQVADEETDNAAPIKRVNAYDVERTLPPPSDEGSAKGKLSKTQRKKLKKAKKFQQEAEQRQKQEEHQEQKKEERQAVVLGADSAQDSDPSAVVEVTLVVGWDAAVTIEIRQLERAVQVEPVVEAGEAQEEKSIPWLVTQATDFAKHHHVRASD
jgi:hypothetical protein